MMRNLIALLDKALRGQSDTQSKEAQSSNAPVCPSLVTSSQTKVYYLIQRKVEAIKQWPVPT